MRGYDQIFIVGGVPAIGESHVLCPKQTGEWRALQLVRMKGNPPIPELLNTSIWVMLAQLRIRRTQGVEIIHIMKEKAHFILFFENLLQQVLS